MNFPNSNHSETQKVLLAEDDTLIRELVSVYLQRLGYEVIEAKNGAVALDLMSSHKACQYDLIVTDLLMPKAGGERVIKEAEAYGVCDRFLVMTGNPILPGSNPARISGQFEYIEKPFTFGDFEARLSSLTGERIA